MNNTNFVSWVAWGVGLGRAIVVAVVTAIAIAAAVVCGGGLEVAGLIGAALGVVIGSIGAAGEMVKGGVDRAKAWIAARAKARAAVPVAAVPVRIVTDEGGVTFVE